MSTSLPQAERIVMTWPNWRTIAASPVMYAMILPLLLFDLFLEIFHRTVFPVLGIPLAPRREYVRFDRHRLPYLPWILKLACSYCSYANGLIQYAGRIAGDTEWHFCPSKHHLSTGFHPPPHHQYFAAYGDREEFQKRFQGLKVAPAMNQTDTGHPSSGPSL